MNMENKLCTIKLSCHLMTDSQSVPEQQSWNAKLINFPDFSKLLKKTYLPEKFGLPDKRGFKLMKIRRDEKHSCP